MGAKLLGDLEEWKLKNWDLGYVGFWGFDKYGRLDGVCIVKPRLIVCPHHPILQRDTCRKTSLFVWEEANQLFSIECSLLVIKSIYESGIKYPLQKGWPCVRYKVVYGI